jgi:parvulin-like peptidyl-prolyl isomerase
MKKILKSFVPVILILSLTLTGCSTLKVKAERRKVVAEVNGEKVLKGEFLDAYASEKASYGITEEVEANEEYKEDISNLKKSILENLIYEKLINQKAKEAGFKITDEITKQANDQFKKMMADIEAQMKAQETGESTEKVDYAAKAKEYVDGQLKTIGKTQEQYIKMIAQQIMTQQFVEKTVGQADVTDGEIKTYYDAQVKAQKEGAAPGSEELDLYGEPQVLVKHILIALPEAEQTEYQNLIKASKTEEAKKYLQEKLKGIYPKAKEALGKVKNGGDFEKLIAEYGGDPGMVGNSQGYVVKRDGQFIPEFENASFSLKEGQISDLVAGPFGYHIIKVEDKQTEKLETIKEDLKKSILLNKKDTEYQKILDDMKAKAKIQKYPDNA